MMMNDEMELICECVHCGKSYILKVPFDGYLDWKYKGKAIEKAMPNLDWQTEQSLTSGLCFDCQCDIDQEEFYREITDEQMNEWGYDLYDEE